MMNETKRADASTWFAHVQLDETKRGLAKLLAKENISVIHEAGAKTASFDLQTRTLTLPMWTGISVDQYDLLIGHEVGHAKYSNELEMLTAPDVTKGLHTFINVLEDTRIERMMKSEFPGLRAAFRRGYAEFAENGPLFKLEKPAGEYKFIDRVNIHYKIGHVVDVPFTDVERTILTRIDALVTMRDAIALARELYAREKEDKNKPEPKPEQPTPAKGAKGDKSEPSDSDDSGDSSDEDNETSDAGAKGEKSDDTSEDDTKPAGTESTDGDGDEDKGKTDAADDDDSDQESSNSSDTNGQAAPPKVAKPAEEDPTSETDVANERAAAEIETVGQSRFSGQPEQLTIGTLSKSQYDIMVVSNETYNNGVQGVFGQYSDTHTQSAAWLTKITAKHAKSVAQMAMEFERRKNAKRMEHARVSRTGRLDLNKLHAYKYRDDIFQSVVNLPNGQSHGIVMLIDASGSMSGVMTDTMEQAMLFAMFAKRVNIPFHAFYFTQNRTDTGYGTSFGSRESRMFAGVAKGSILPNSSAELIHIFDTTNAKTWKTQLMGAAAFASRYDAEYQTMGHGYLPHTQLGSTPLYTGMQACEYAVAALKSSRKLEKMTFLICTDGDDTDGMITLPRTSARPMRTNTMRFIARDTVTKHVYTNFTVAPGSNPKDPRLDVIKNAEWGMLVDMFHRRHDCRVVAIKITSSSKRSRYGSMNALLNGSQFFHPEQQGQETQITAADLQATSKTWEAHAFIAMPAHTTPADAALIIGSSSLEVVDADEEFRTKTSGGTATAKQVAKAFKSANVDASTNKLFIGAVMPFIA